MDSLPTPRRRRSNSPSALTSTEAMQTLRLPPLRFLTQTPSAEFNNCVLPPITPPPSRLSPSTNNASWHHSPAVPSSLPSPSPISPATQLPHFSRPPHSDDIRLSPITHTPPSTIRPLPPPSVLPAAGPIAAYSSIPNSPQQYHPPHHPRSGLDAYPTQSRSPSLSLPPLSPPEHYSANYQNFRTLSKSPVAPWHQPVKVHRPTEFAAPVQLSMPAYHEMNQTIALQQSQKQTFPHTQPYSAQADTTRTLPVAGGYYNDGTPIQRMGPPLKQESFLTIGALTSAGAGPSTQAPPNPETDVKSPVKKTIKTDRGIRDVYECPYPNCKRRSTEQSNMKAHMRMHTGEKPYVCRNKGCMKAFRWKSSLTYHEKALHVKSRPFKCSPCRRSFVEKRKLKMHFDLCPVNRRHREQGKQGDEGCLQ